MKIGKVIQQIPFVNQLLLLINWTEICDLDCGIRFQNKIYYKLTNILTTVVKAKYY